MLTHAVIAVCLFVIGCLIAYIRNLRIRSAESFDNWGFWEKACKAARHEVSNLHVDIKQCRDQLNSVREHLAEELENNCRLVKLLNDARAKLADAELRIAAATENLTNQPRVIVEDECPF